MLQLALITLSFILSVVVTYGVKRLASRARLLAVATERSSHQGVIPVGGGLGIVVVFLLSIAGLYGVGLIATNILLVLLCAIPIALAGLFDDRQHLDFRKRLIIQAGFGLLAFYFVGSLPAIPFGPFGLPLSFAGIVLVPIAFIWLTNLYNFMDGIDGIAGMQGIFVCGGASVMFLQHNDVTLALLCGLLMAAHLGFLVFNWPPASIFMGDVGSGFCGFMFGALALLGHAHGTMSLWSWVLLLGVFIVDASVTLFTRWRLGLRWYEAHRTHVYQKLALRYGSHSAVVWRILLLNVLWFLPLALLAGKQPEYGVYFAIVGLLPLGVFAIKMEAGKPAQST
jgi:Fuc2NAc and GlcNAc transferase